MDKLAETIPPEGPDDRELVRRILENDPQAFNELLGRYQKPIHQFYLQKTANNVQDSKDLLQDTFVKVYLNLHTYNAEFTFSQWIFAVARNTFIDYTRKKREPLLSIDHSDDGHTHIHPASSLPTPEERLILSQHSKELSTVLLKMTPKYQEIITLRFFNQYSYEEIAEHMELPIGTVKTLIHRAREILLKNISGNGTIF